MFCNQCGTEIINNANFCTSCGASAVIMSDQVEGSKTSQWFSKIKSSKIKDPYDMTPIINLSATNTSKFNKYFFGLFFVYLLLNVFAFIFMNPNSGYTLLQAALIGIIGISFLNIPLILSYFLKKKRIGAFFAGLNFALYLGLSVWDFYDRFIAGDEHLKRGEGILIIATIVISWKLFDLVRKYPSLIGKV